MHFDAIKMKVIRPTKNKCLHKGRCPHAFKRRKDNQNYQYFNAQFHSSAKCGALVNRKHHPADQYAGSHNTLPLLGPLASL